MVISIVLVLVGAITILGLPVAQFPNIVLPRFKFWRRTLGGRQGAGQAVAAA